MKAILYENERGYITLEPTGKSMSYIVWLSDGVAAKRTHAIGFSMANAFDRAKGKLQ